jgi:hypothetical protein
MTDAHVLAIRPQEAQSVEAATAEARLSELALVRQQGPAWSVIGDEGVLALAGVVTAWTGRGVAWCLLSQEAGRQMIPLTRAVRAYLSGLSYRRIEMYVDAQFVPGCRWATLLGFRNEGRMAAFFPNGNDAFMYGRAE